MSFIDEFHLLEKLRYFIHNTDEEQSETYTDKYKLDNYIFLNIYLDIKNNLNF